MKKINYYDVETDIKKMGLKDWCLLVIGGNSTGKTYSTLKYCYKNKIKFAFVKRTNDDVKILCNSDSQIDLSPFKSINKKEGCEVYAKSLDKGIGVFYENNENIGYILSLNAIANIKGFDLSDVDIYVFDEFIPVKTQVVKRSEGLSALILYQLINRDRELQGRKPLLFIGLANAMSISNPLTNELEIVDDIAEMKINELSYKNKNGICIHLLDDNEEYRNMQSENAIFRSLKNTAFGAMSLNNDFSYDSFNKIKKVSLKGYKCLTGFTYKNNTYYIYKKNAYYYICRSKQGIKIYDLNFESEQYAFYYKYVIDIKIATANNKAFFETFTQYDIIFNFKKYFKIN